jgi:hypothetical protein
VILSLGAWRVYGLVEDGVEHDRDVDTAHGDPRDGQDAERFRGP